MNTYLIPLGKKNWKCKNLNQNRMSIRPLRKIKMDPKDALQFNFEKTCIVYTTKLDDMHTFNDNMEHADIKEIFDNILIESLPRLKKMQSYIYPPSYPQKRKYNKMQNTLKNMQQKSSILKRLANKLKFHTDYLKNNNTRSLKYGSDIRVKSKIDIDEKVKDDLNLLNSSSDFFIKSGLDPKGLLKNKTNFSEPLCRITCIKSELDINDQAKPNSDILIYKEHCHDNITDNLNTFPSISERNRFKNFVSVESTNVDKVNKSILLENNTERISSDALECKTKLDFHNFSRPSEVFIADGKQIFLEDLPIDKINLPSEEFTGQIPSNPTFLSRDVPQYLAAFQQFLKLSDETDIQTQMLTTSNDLLRKKSHQTSTNRVIVITNRYSNDVDVYSMNKVGCLIYYYKTNKNDVEKVLSEFPKITHSHRKEICCWYKREQFIKILGTKFINIVTQRFMRKPHLCYPGKCTCCCKEVNFNDVEKSSSAPVVNYELSLEENPTFDLENDISKTVIKVPIRNSESSSGNNSLKGILPKKSNLLKTEIDNDSKNPSSHGIVKENCLRNMNNIDSKRGEGIKSHKIELTKLINRNTETTINTSKIAEVDSPRFQQCINTILGTLEGVRFTINEERKVAAVLHSPVNTLSTSALSILASVMTCAQKEVDTVGVLPSLINLTLKPIEPGVPSKICATKELTIQLIPEPKKTFLKANHSNTPVIKNVFSLKSTNEITSSIANSSASTSCYGKTNGTILMNQLNLAKKTTNNSSHLEHIFGQDNSIRTFEKKRKLPEEQQIAQKKVKSVAMSPSFGNMSVLTNVSTKTDHINITNNVSNVLPSIIQPINQQSQSVSILSEILSKPNKQNEFMNLNSMTTPLSQAVRYVTPDQIIPASSATMLLVSPLILAPHPLSIVKSTNNKLIAESVIYGNNKMESQMTIMNNPNTFVKSEIETLDSKIEVVESFYVKEEESILGV